MPEVCPKCGLPKSLCVCGVIEREAQVIRVYVEKRRYGKYVTIVEGITGNVKEISSKLKSMLACGGTIKNGRIELQGDHQSRLREILLNLGYGEEQIQIT